jgi:enoyl-CoA hydratase/carnithine racemase
MVLVEHRHVDCGCGLVCQPAEPCAASIEGHAAGGGFGPAWRRASLGGPVLQSTRMRMMLASRCCDATQCVEKGLIHCIAPSCRGAPRRLAP